MKKPTCQVCNQKESIGVACSALGPISLAYCKDCAENHAEPLGLTFSTMQLIVGGGYSAAEVDAAIAEWFKQGVKVYHEGKYLSWNEYLPMYIEWDKNNPEPDYN